MDPQTSLHADADAVTPALDRDNSQASLESVQEYDNNQASLESCQTSPFFRKLSPILGDSSSKSTCTNNKPRSHRKHVTIVYYNAVV